MIQRYEGYTPEYLRYEILNNMSDIINKLEGGFAADMAAAVALRLSELYDELNALLSVLFLDTIYGELLDLRAAEYGITRRPSTQAETAVRIGGKEGAVLPEGTLVTTADNLLYAVTTTQIYTSDVVRVVVVRAIEGGAKYNVPAGSIIGLVNPVAGIYFDSAPWAATGGTDTEGDDALRARVLHRLRNPSTSGNANHYMQWALETPGVEAAKVEPLWAGNGTVRVIVAGTGMTTPAGNIITACRSNIEAQRPIGAEVTVIGATEQRITINATITRNDTPLTDIQTAFEAAVGEYFRAIAFSGQPVSRNKIAHLLMSTAGVDNWTTLTLNNGTADITILADRIPTLGGVTLAD